MNRIRLLPEHVANQIAAGEVVERPASVVKELVENALDAQAMHLAVEIQAGGRSLIRVTDNGTGMSRDDVLLCLERHATSKIQRAEDLSAVSTMGFRGEALPSIASVSRLTLTAREPDSDVATQAVVNGGRIVEVKAAGSPPGTRVEVRQLFYNLPARRKFLRSEETEYAHIHHYLTLAALAYPEVAFTFTKDGRIVWRLPAVRTENTAAARLAAVRERLRTLLGGESDLLTVDCAGRVAAAGPPDEAGDAAGPRDPGACVRIWGIMGKPGVSRATRENQYVFVNRRPVENRGLNHALLEGYHTALMKGRYPVCCLFLEIDPASVDVNIHPTKREVRFHQERAVRKFVAEAVRQALLRFHAPSPADAPAAPTPAQTSVSAAATSPGPAAGEVTREFPAFTPLTGTPLTTEPRFAPRLAFPTPPSPTQSAPQFPGAAPTPDTADQAPPAIPFPILEGEAVPLLMVPLRLVGVIGRLYVVLESDRGLVLMDQHAAHERILFEQMLARLEQGNAPSQRLLLPETVELSIRDAHFLRGQLATLTRLGVGLSEFGERTFLLDALPPFVKAREPRQLVLELVDELKAAAREMNSHRLGEQAIAKAVCRHAVKAHDALAGAELEQLITDLRHCAMPYTCPHGRPTLIEMSYRELEKKFGRVTG